MAGIPNTYRVCEASVGFPSGDVAKLLLRVALGLLILLHGIAKIKGGLGPIPDMVARMGLPAAFAYAAYLGEVVAPILLIVGLWTRVAALVVAINMVIAIALVHVHDLVRLGNQGGYALELQALYVVVAIAVVLLGAGRYSVGGSGGRWN